MTDQPTGRRHRADLRISRDATPPPAPAGEQRSDAAAGECARRTTRRPPRRRLQEAHKFDLGHRRRGRDRLAGRLHAVLHGFGERGGHQRLGLGVGVPRLLRLVRGLGRPGRCARRGGGAVRRQPADAVHQVAAGAVRPRAAVPDPRPVHLPGRGTATAPSGLGGITCDTGRGFGYWLALLAVLAGGALSVMRMRESTTASPRPPDPPRDACDGRRPIRSAPVALLVLPQLSGPGADARGARPTSYAAR